MSTDDQGDQGRGIFCYLHAGKRTLKYERRFAAWAFLWAVTLLTCGYLIKNEIVPEVWVWPLALLPSIVAIFPIVSYYRFVMRADELIRKIQLESICLSFAFTMFFIFASMSFRLAGLEAPTIENIAVVMSLSWMLSQFYCMWKYR